MDAFAFLTAKHAAETDLKRRFHAAQEQAFISFFLGKADEALITHIRSFFYSEYGGGDFYPLHRSVESTRQGYIQHVCWTAFHEIRINPLLLSDKHRDMAKSLFFAMWQVATLPDRTGIAGFEAMLNRYSPAHETPEYRAWVDKCFSEKNFYKLVYIDTPAHITRSCLPAVKLHFPNGHQAFD